MERSYYPIEKPLVERTRVLEMFDPSSDVLLRRFLPSQPWEEVASGLNDIRTE